MSSWFQRSFGYGLGSALGRAVFGVIGDEDERAPLPPIHQQTEEEIRADEKRFDEEAKRYAAEDRSGVGRT